MAALEIAVIGGTGGVGVHFVQLALDRGHKLTVLARTAPPNNNIHYNLQPRRENLTIIQGDATKLEDVQKIVSPTTDVLVSMAGNNASRRVMMEQMGKNIILAVAPPKRAIVVTSLGMNGTSRTLRLLLGWTLGKHAMDDCEACDKMLCHEPNFTVVRPDGMVEQTPGNGKYALTLKGGMGPGNLPKADVALCLADLVEDAQYDGMGGVQLYR